MAFSVDFLAKKNLKLKKPKKETKNLGPFRFAAFKSLSVEARPIQVALPAEAQHLFGFKAGDRRAAYFVKSVYFSPKAKA